MILGRDGEQAEIRRFWALVASRSEPHRCWRWKGRTDTRGYGRLTFDRAERYAHRVAWELTEGWCPPRLDRWCVERSCCNPAHQGPRPALEPRPDEWMARFHHHVPSRPPEGCWMWTGPRINGYGVLTTRGERRPAHQLAWELQTQRPARYLMVVHTCGVRLCVNPEHLSDDPSATGYRKLEEWDAAEIRESVATGTPQAELARSFGVSRSLVSRIVAGSRWAHAEAWVEDDS